MASIVATAIGLALYFIGAKVDPGLGAALGVLVLVALIPLVVAAAVIGHGKPFLTAVLVQAWTPLILTLAGGAAALVLYVGVELAVDDLKGADKALLAGGLAIIVSVITLVRTFLESKLAPWFSYEYARRRYLKLFPRPQRGQDSPGRKAYELICVTREPFQTSGWTRTAFQETLEAVRDAIKAGQYLNGKDWHPLTAQVVPPTS
jgi:hypothetical protein